MLAGSWVLAPRACAQTTGAAFLKIDAGARPAALGGAYTAMADDVNALYYNPGGLPLMTRREMGATHAQWLLGSKFDAVGFAQPTRMGVFGLGLARLGTGSQEARDADGRLQGSLDAADTAYTLGFGRAVAGRTSLGASVKYLESRIGSDRASAFALDLGVMRRFGAAPLTLGFSVLNLGRGIRFLDQVDPLPLTVSLGGAYRLAGALNLAMDLRHEPYARRSDVGIGTEYAVLGRLALRAGYATSAPAGAMDSSFAGLGGGLGLRLGDYRADYTFTPFGLLGNVQRLSLGARW